MAPANNAMMAARLRLSGDFVTAAGSTGCAAAFTDRGVIPVVSRALRKDLFRSARETTGITPRSVNAAAQPVEPAAVTKSPESRRRAAIIALFAGAIGIGFAPILVRLSQVGPSATAAFRILLALPILWLFVLVERRKGRGIRQPETFVDFKFLAIAGLFFTGDLSLWHWSLQITTVANSTLLTNFAPIFVTIGACLFLGEKVSTRFVIALLVAIGGAALLALQSVSLSTRQMWGDLLAIFTAGV